MTGTKKRKYIELHGEALLVPSLQLLQEFMSTLENFARYVPSHTPEYWNFHEPINRKFNLAELHNELEKIPDRYILWRRRSSPKGWGSMNKRWHHLSGFQHAKHAFYLSTNDDEQVEQVIKYLHFLAKRFGVAYAFCDSLSPAYVLPARINGFAPYGLMGAPTLKLIKRLPDIAWAQIFGSAYTALFGMEKLLSAPAHKVIQLTPDTVYLQLSPSLFDMHEKFEEVDAIRQQVKAYLDDNIIFDSSLPADHVYRTPQFEFPD